MAHQYDPNFEQKYLYISDRLIIRLRLAFAKVIRLKRRLLRPFFPQPQLIINPNLSHLNWTKIQHDLSHTGYAYTDQFFDQESWEIIRLHWPSINQFDPPTDHYKTNDHGFYWKPKFDMNFSKHAFIMDQLTKFFSSDSFISKVSHLIEKTTLQFYSFRANTYPLRSYVVSHIDSATHVNERIESLNFIIFIDGDPSSGTFLTKNYDAKNADFVPTNMRNSCLIYNTKAPFFHGVLPIRHTERKSIIINLKNKQG